MSTELIINASLPETRISLLENGEIQELLIERASGKGIVGNIYKGRVTRVLPGMQAAFVDIGLEKAAFLYVDDVYVHSDIWETEEAAAAASSTEALEGENGTRETVGAADAPAREAASASGASKEPAQAARTDEEAVMSPEGVDIDAIHERADAEMHEDLAEAEAYELDDEESAQEGIEEEVHAEIEEADEEDFDEEDEDDDEGPVEMGPPPGDESENDSTSGAGEQPEGTVKPEEPRQAGGEAEGSASARNSEEGQQRDASRRRRRGRRGGRGGRGDRNERGRSGEEVRAQRSEGSAPSEEFSEDMPENVQSHLSDTGEVTDSDRAAMVAQRGGVSQVEGEGRPEHGGEGSAAQRGGAPGGNRNKGEFNQPRTRDRRIRPKQGSRPSRGNVNIQDLLKEGQEVIVQVAKDPIATKGARLTCHLSLPGRHLVCMPTIDHVGVSRRIERDDERRKLREYVERYRPKNLGFIVRTASGRQNSEQRIKQDIEYLTRIWNEIREKAASVAAPALVYEDLNSVLRAIRDWVTDEIDKIVVDSRYHYNEILRFVSHFMPSLKQKVELYHGDIPVFDAYGITTELSRALERKVWLKSGGYLVIDQAEALVAIDVNTGRFVGKKNLEDTILKTNLEAVQEIAYQLRLRNCGGIIILDLIDMEKEENKQRVYRALEEALKKDRARPSILKISELGLVEMTRKRTRDTMVRALCESCSHCEGKGFIKSKQTVAYEILREIEREGIERNVTKVLIQAHPDVIDIMAIDERETLDQLERRYRKQIYLQAVTDFHPEQFEVSGDKQEGARPQPSAERGREPREWRGGESREGREDRGRRGRDRGRDRNRDRDRDRDRGRGEGRRPQPAVQAGVPSVTPAHPVGTAESAASRYQSEGGAQPQQGAPSDEFEEEDRLAFLRAQAAQDAALAKLRASGGAPGAGEVNPRHGGRNGGEGRQAQGQGGGRDDRRGGRRGRRGRKGVRTGGEGRRPQPNSGSNGASASTSSEAPSVPAPVSDKPDHQNPV